MDREDRRFRKSEHLRNSGDIRAIMTKGRSVGVFGLKMMFKPNDATHSRVAFVLKRKYGTAVERNRIKRLLRESYRLLKPELEAGFDIVFLAFPGSDTYSDRSRQVRILVRNAGMLK